MPRQLRKIHPKIPAMNICDLLETVHDNLNSAAELENDSILAGDLKSAAQHINDIALKRGCDWAELSPPGDPEGPPDYDPPVVDDPAPCLGMRRVYQPWRRA